MCDNTPDESEKLERQNLMSRPKPRDSEIATTFSDLECWFMREWLDETSTRAETEITLTRDELTEFLVWLAKKPAAEWRDVYPYPAEMAESDLIETVNGMIFKVAALLRRFDFEHNELFTSAEWDVPVL